MQDIAFIHEKYKQSLSDTYGYRHVFEGLLIDIIHKNGVRTVEGNILFALKPEIVDAIVNAILDDEKLDDALKYSILSIFEVEMINEFFGEYAIWNSVNKNDGYNWENERLVIIFDNLLKDGIINTKERNFKLERKGESLNIQLGTIDIKLLYGGEDGEAERLNNYLKGLVETASRATWLDPNDPHRQS